MWLVLWEIIIPLLVAFAIGLFVGWMIWRWRRTRLSMAEWAQSIEEDPGVLELRSERDDLSARLKGAEKNLAAASTRAHELEVDRNTLKGNAATLTTDLRESRGEVSRLEGELGVGEARIRQLEADLEAAHSGAAAPDAELAQARARIDELAAATGLAADRVEALRGEVNSLTAERDDLAERERTARDELNSARAEVASLAGLRPEVDGAAERVSALEAEVVAGHARAEDLNTQLGAAHSRIADLEDRLAADPASSPVASFVDDETPALDVVDLRDPIDDGESAVPDLVDPGTDGAEPSWQTGLTKLGTAAAAHTDDLKVINGIGPKMESILHEFEITSWEQIAAFSPDDVAKVSDAIETFPGRIERDEWVEQARDLVRRFPDLNDRPTRATFLNRSAEGPTPV